MSKNILFAAALALVGACLFAAEAQSRSTAGDRIVRSLNANWSFSQKDPQDLQNLNPDNADWHKVNLPHTWNDKDAFDETPGYRRGPAWYARDLDLPANLYNKRLYLYFEGANQTAEVYVNTHLVGKHIGGYTAFCYDITDEVTLGKPNEMAIRVDNGFNENIPPLSADFTFYGGIYRNVWLIAVDDVHFKTDDLASSGVQISTPDFSGGGSHVLIQGKISNTGTTSKNVEVWSFVFNAAGKLIASVKSPTKVSTKSEITFENFITWVSNPHLWSPDDPYLYSVRNEIRENGKVVDVVTQPLGFRWYKFDADTGFYLNGKHLNLRGTNRHQDYSGLGNAVPDRLLVHDMELIKDAGFNFVRLAHYPQAPAVLQAADRLGILIWEETPLVNYITASQAFTDNSETMVREMIRQHRNHPSVILWGYMNEIYLRVPKGSDDLYPATVALARKLNSVAHAEDPTRLTTIALHGSDIYNKYGLAEVPDVVGWNLYQGWYGGEFPEFGQYMDDQHRRFPKRPLIVSEYGGNSDRRLHSTDPHRFDQTTEYQRLLHESYLAQIDARPYIAGSTLWSTNDFGSEFRGESIPHVNTKGLFTYDRQPKDVLFFYKAGLSQQPVLHIAVGDHKYWAGPPDAAQSIDIYSNLSEAELVCNGVSLGKKRVDGSRKATWTVPLKDGKNQLVARGMRDGKAVTDSADVYYKSVSLTSPEIAVNVGSDANYTDTANTVWLADQPYKKGGWGFIGDKAKPLAQAQGIPDILGTNDDPLFQAMLEGLSGYRFDVPAGSYEVTLLFVDTKSDAAGKRVFDVKIDGKIAAEKLDITAEAGFRHALTKRFTTISTDGVTVELVRSIGEPLLSGIRIRKL